MNEPLRVPAPSQNQHLTDSRCRRSPCRDENACARMPGPAPLRPHRELCLGVEGVWIVGGVILGSV